MGWCRRSQNLLLNVLFECFAVSLFLGCICLLQPLGIVGGIQSLKYTGSLCSNCVLIVLWPVIRNAERKLSVWRKKSKLKFGATIGSWSKKRWPPTRTLLPREKAWQSWKRILCDIYFFFKLVIVYIIMQPLLFLLQMACCSLVSLIWCSWLSNLASHLFTRLDCTDCGALDRYNIHRLVLPSLNMSLDHPPLCCMFSCCLKCFESRTNSGVCSVH